MTDQAHIIETGDESCRFRRTLAREPTCTRCFRHEAIISELIHPVHTANCWLH